MSSVSRTPKPSYYAAIFTSINADVDHAEHIKMSARMLELATGIDGFLGIEPARNTDGTGVAVSISRTWTLVQAPLRRSMFLLDLRSRSCELLMDHFNMIDNGYRHRPVVSQL